MACVSITLAAPVEKVWDALTRPELIKQYFFGTETETDWKPGSPIYFRGMWNGKAYEDRSSFSGKADLPENYQTMTYELHSESRVTDPPHDRFWGGYSGYFEDLDGHLWEIAWNPEWEVKD